MNTQVEVKSNSLRAEGMIAIAEALKVNSTVTKIDVSDNEIAAWFKYGTFGHFTATREGQPSSTRLGPGKGGQIGGVGQD